VDRIRASLFFPALAENFACQRRAWGWVQILHSVGDLSPNLVFAEAETRLRVLSEGVRAGPSLHIEEFEDNLTQKKLKPIFPKLLEYSGSNARKGVSAIEISAAGIHGPSFRGSRIFFSSLPSFRSWVPGGAKGPAGLRPMW